MAAEKDCLIVLSGGMDSVTLLYDWQERIAGAISFDYGANHRAHELPFAVEHCKRLGIPHDTVELPFVSKLFESSLLSGAEEIPDGSYTDDRMHSTVVPFRNAIMLSIAVGIAESRNLKQVLIASHGGDHAIYPDCRDAFVQAFSTAARLGTYAGISVVAPYTGLSKSQIASRGHELSIDYSRTYSCYRGGERHCGRCSTCIERKEAFREAGIKDPTEYEE